MEMTDACEVLEKCQEPVDEQRDFLLHKMKSTIERNTERIKVLENRIMKLCEDRPMYRGFELYSERIKTFREWDFFLKPSEKELAAAGFFYTGQGDKTQCFYCGIKLCHWRPNDIPIKEHNKYSPKCLYLLQSADVC